MLENTSPDYTISSIVNDIFTVINTESEHSIPDWVVIEGVDTENVYVEEFVCHLCNNSRQYSHIRILLSARNEEALLQSIHPQTMSLSSELQDDRRYAMFFSEKEVIPPEMESDLADFTRQSEFKFLFYFCYFEK